MAASAIILYYSAMILKPGGDSLENKTVLYTNEDRRPLTCPLLDCLHQEQRWRFSLLHATCNEHHRTLSTSRGGGEHQHPLYHLVLYISGNNTCLVNSKQHPTSPGTLILISPQESHSFTPQQPGTTGYHEITFELKNPDGLPLEISCAELLQYYAGCLLSIPGRQQLARPETISLAHKFRAVIQSSLQMSPHADLTLAKAVLAVFHAMVVRLTAHSGRCTDPVERVRRCLEQNLAGKITIPELEEIGGLSRRHLFRRFFQTYGTTPLAWRETRRLEAAAFLLETTTQSCGEIG